MDAKSVNKGPDSVSMHGYHLGEVLGLFVPHFLYLKDGSGCCIFSANLL